MITLYLVTTEIDGLPVIVAIEESFEKAERVAELQAIIHKKGFNISERKFFPYGIEYPNGRRNKI